MKKYSFKSEGYQRLVGVVTGDDDIGIGYARGELSKVTTHKHTRSAEYYICTRGSGTIWVAPREGKPRIYRLSPGIIRKIEKDEPHLLLSILREPYEVFSFQVPGGIDKVDVDEPPELKELMKRHGLLSD
jgi:mannose-6-phosphate isomerase-like protein (cupin superfamily)